MLSLESSNSYVGSGGFSMGGGIYGENSANSPTSSEATSTQLTGYLYKKSTSGEWQKRYFEVNGNYLIYYKTQKMSKLLAAVDITQVGLITLVGEMGGDKDAPGEKGAVFQIELKDRQFLLKAPSVDEAQRWVDLLVALRDSGRRQSLERGNSRGGAANIKGGYAAKDGAIHANRSGYTTGYEDNASSFYNPMNNGPSGSNASDRGGILPSLAGNRQDSYIEPQATLQKSNRSVICVCIKRQ